MTKTIVPGYVDTLEPFTVRLAGVDDVAQPAEHGGYAEAGMRGMVDISGGGRLWIGEYQSDGVPTEVRQSMSALSQAVEDVTGATNDNAEGFDRFTAQYSLDRTATAVELTDIRDSVADIELSAVTTTRLAVISQDAGLYIDPTFSDAAISAERATNTGMVYTAGSGLSGTSATVFLTGQGKDEGLTIPLIPQDRYTARVWGTGLTAANGRVLAIKHSNGVITDLPTVYGTGYMAATAVPTSAGARLLVRRISGTGSATITRVEVRHGIGGTLIDDNSIDADKINVDKAVVGLKLTSPNIETNPAANRGIKIIDDRLTGYSPTGQLLIDIGGPTGLIKGVLIQGASLEATQEIAVVGGSETIGETFIQGGFIRLAAPAGVGNQAGLISGHTDGLRINTVGPGDVRIGSTGPYTNTVIIHDRNMQTLFNDFDTVKTKSDSTPQIQYGTGSMGIAASSTAGALVGRIVVTFPTAFAAGTFPRVMASARGSATELDKLHLHVEASTSTNFTVRANTITDHGALTGVPIDWIAVK